MSFRGVLLRLEEAAGDVAFRVVAPDAALVVPSASAAGAADQRVVASDAASGKLLSVVRLASVSPRAALRSALWVATETPKDAANGVGVSPVARDAASKDGEADATAREGASAAAARACWPSVELSPPAAATRVCFCFYFRSEFEFELFARAAEAYVNAQRFALLRSSVLIELQVQRDLDATSNAGLQAAADAAAQALGMKGKSPPIGALTDVMDGRGRGRGRSGGRGRGRGRGDTSTRLKAELKPEPQSVRPAATSTTPTAAAVSTSTSPRYSRAELDAIPAALKVEHGRNGGAADQQVARPDGASSEPAVCIMCRFCPKSDAEAQLKDHPFVLQDGRGNKIRVCKICLQKVLQRRLNVAGGAPLVASTAGLCNLCSEPTSQLSKSKVKQCAHEMCKNRYCAPCIDKLIGKAQAHKVWRTKKWLCTNCTTFQGPSATSADAGSTAGAVKPDRQSALEDVSCKNKKRRRLQILPTEDVISSELPVAVPPSSSAEVTQAPLMTPLDYAASYFQFLAGREEANPPEDESEDVCFCCKDGGEVIECDWKGLNNKFVRCPKVYHEDCLGYEVPEGKAWYCPRHRCHQCGILADFHCRFCVTSYCEVHLPAEVPRLGPGSADIPNATYVLCPRCIAHASEAVAQGKLPRDFHARVFCSAT